MALNERVGRHGADGDEILALVSSIFAAPIPDPTSLPPGDADLLDSIGAVTDMVPGTGRQQLAASYSSVVAASYSVETLAARIGVGASRIRQRLNSDRTLWGFKVGPRQQWQIPDWHLVGDTLLPGVEVIAPVIPSDIHPVAAAAMVTTTNPDLVIDGSVVSVRDWLLAGNDPAVAAAAIGDPAEIA